jgi:hypothetical protein
VPFVASDTECGGEISFHRSHKVVPFGRWDDLLSLVVFIKVAVPEILAFERILRISLFHDRFTPPISITVFLFTSDKIDVVDLHTLLRPPLLPIFAIVFGDVEDFLQTFSSGGVTASRRSPWL